MRMRAYYYSFTPTGCEPVDKILSAVASAGKGYHHTEDWGEAGRDGKSEVDKMQEAANEAATAFKSQP